MITVKKFINIFNIFLLTFSVVITDSFKDKSAIINNAQVIIIIMVLIYFLMSNLYIKTTLNQLIIMIIIICISLVVTYETHSSKIFLLVLYTLACRILTVKEALMDVFISRILDICITLTLFIFGNVNDLDNNEVGRHSFGFGQPNILGVSIFIIEMLIMIYIAESNHVSSLKLGIIGILQIPLLYFLFVSGSAGSKIGIAISLVIMLFQNPRLFKGRSQTRINKLLATGSIFSVPLISFLFLNSSVDTIGSRMYELNEIFTNRLHLAYSFYKQYGLSFLGQKIEYNFNLSQINLYAFIDNAYIELAIHYGIITLIGIVTYHFCIHRESMRQNKQWITIAVVALSIYGFVEQGYGQFWVNPIFSLSSLLYWSSDKRRYSN